MTEPDHRLLRAMRREPVDRTPIWIMRQAGRYLPEYRALRQQAGSFLKLLKTPELAAQVTLQPLARFALDGAILFSDILTIPDAMGLGLHFIEGEGPKFERPVRTAAAIESLRPVNFADDLGYVTDTIALVRRELGGRAPLIGFSGSPWTLATYMVEGGASQEFSLIKSLLYREPRVLGALVNRLADEIINYLKAQIGAGVDAVMLFDTWGGILTPSAYREFSLGPMISIIRALKADAGCARVPIILFTKGGGNWLHEMAASGCDVLGLDWTLDIGAARRQVGDRVALQGNLDPAALRGTPDGLREEISLILASYGAGSGHVFNLGHGVQPDIDPGMVGACIDAVHELSAPYHV